MTPSPRSIKPLFVVPCLNEVGHIRQVLHQLKQARARLGGDVVIVDGGSIDGTREIAEREAAAHTWLHLLDNPAKIQSAAINLAVDTYGSGATHLFRFDAHSAYPEDYCDVLLTEMARTGAASVVVSMRADGSETLQRAIAATQNAAVGNGGSKHRMKAVGAFVDHGHHALMDLAAYRSVGGYDATFRHNEDAELDHRLRRDGYKIWLTGATEVTYFPRESFRPLARQYFNHGTGRARNILKHQTTPKLRQMKAIAILPLVSLSALAPVSVAFILPLLLWVAYCSAMALSLALNARDPMLLLAAPIAMIMHLSWSVGFWATCLNAPKRSVAKPA